MTDYSGLCCARVAAHRDEGNPGSNTAHLPTLEAYINIAPSPVCRLPFPRHITTRHQRLEVRRPTARSVCDSAGCQLLARFLVCHERCALGHGKAEAQQPALRLPDQILLNPAAVTILPPPSAEGAGAAGGLLSQWVELVQAVLLLLPLPLYPRLTSTSFPLPFGCPFAPRPRPRPQIDEDYEEPLLTVVEGAADGGPSTSTGQGRTETTRAAIISVESDYSLYSRTWQQRNAFTIYCMALFLCLCVTMSTHPGISSFICSVDNPAAVSPCAARNGRPGLAGRIQGDLFVPLLFVLFRWAIGNAVGAMALATSSSLSEAMVKKLRPAKHQKHLQRID